LVVGAGAVDGVGAGVGAIDGTGVGARVGVGNGAGDGDREGTGVAGAVGVEVGAGIDVGVCTGIAVGTGVEDPGVAADATAEGVAEGDEEVILPPLPWHEARAQKLESSSSVMNARALVMDSSDGSSMLLLASCKD
jgi:hypothetical protein